MRFPPPGSDDTNVTFEINFQFVPGQEYYLLMDLGKHIFLFFINFNKDHGFICKFFLILSQVTMY